MNLAVDLPRLREEERCPSLEGIFQAVVNNNNVLFWGSLLFYIDVSMQLSAQLFVLIVMLDD